MWISKQMNRKLQQKSAERAKVTLADTDVTEMTGNFQRRDAVVYTPYGYSAKIPYGENVLIVPTGAVSACTGSEDRAEGLDYGEVKLTSKGGAVIHLRNDGSIVLNGQVIEAAKGE